jgi:hypothetical protein
LAYEGIRKSILWPKKLLGGIRRMGQCKRPYGPQHTLHSPFARQRKDMPNRRLSRNGETNGRTAYMAVSITHTPLRHTGDTSMHIGIEESPLYINYSDEDGKNRA